MSCGLHIDTLLVLQTRTAGKDAQGGVTNTWGSNTSKWAQVKELAGTERELANKLHAEQTIEVIARYDSEIGVATAADNRFLLGSEVIEILAVMKDHPTRIAYMRFACRKEAN